MQKIDVVLVLLNANNFKTALKTLNLIDANLIAVVVEGGDGRSFEVRGKNIPLMSFASMQNLLNRGADFVWLINGFVNDVSDIWRMKKFLMNSGVPEDNIVNFELMNHISPRWLANLKYIEANGADFFATGISYTEVGLNLNYIPHIRGRGVNLACSNQDLSQGYLTAKYVFEHVKPGTIKFVLIGLTPYSFRYDNEKAFSVTSRNLQYMLALNLPPRNLHDTLLKILVSDNIRDIFKNVTAAYADLNLDELKLQTNQQLPVKAVVDWEAELKNLTKNFYPDTVEKNFRVLEAYIKLCLDNGAKPIGVVFPFAPIIRKKYNAELLTNFRALIDNLKKNYAFDCIDLFDLPLGYDCFYNTAHLNLRGAAFASSTLSLHLYSRKIFPTEYFYSMSYDYFNVLSSLLPKDDYNALMSNVFSLTVQHLRGKPKIKIGFVLYDSAMWCGDELYNRFANDERFETTIFLCLRTDVDGELVQKNFVQGVEKFKSRGLNVVAVSEKNFPVPAHDVLIFLTPYMEVLPYAFQLSRLTLQTLIAYVPYALQSANNRVIYNNPTYYLSWKLFFDTQFHVNLLQRECRMGMPRGFFSGTPKTDAFYDNPDALKFDWKVTRPDAKKIIWAPHWSISSGIRYATFAWNYKFMYEFAKAHPEISWVVKPHPMLLASAVGHGVFDSDEDFQAYLQAWNDLPNAKVFTGPYYQGLFATSDGMIMDCGSWIGEYQYTHKPMIFLTRDTQEFNDLGNALMKILYRVDGKNLNAIAALIKKIFVEGRDDLFDARMKFFDEHMNYIKANGMTAAQFIFKTIATELRL